MKKKYWVLMLLCPGTLSCKLQAPAEHTRSATTLATPQLRALPLQAGGVYDQEVTLEILRENSLEVDQTLKLTEISQPLAELYAAKLGIPANELWVSYFVPRGQAQSPNFMLAPTQGASGASRRTHVASPPPAALQEDTSTAAQQTAAWGPLSTIRGDWREQGLFSATGDIDFEAVRIRSGGNATKADIEAFMTEFEIPKRITLEELAAAENRAATRRLEDGDDAIARELEREQQAPQEMHQAAFRLPGEGTVANVARVNSTPGLVRRLEQETVALIQHRLGMRGARASRIAMIAGLHARMDAAFERNLAVAFPLEASISRRRD